MCNFVGLRLGMCDINRKEQKKSAPICVNLWTVFRPKYKTKIHTFGILKMYKKLIFKQKSCQKMQFLIFGKIRMEGIWKDFKKNNARRKSMETTL